MSSGEQDSKRVKVEDDDDDEDVARKLQHRRTGEHRAGTLTLSSHLEQFVQHWVEFVRVPCCQHPHVTTIVVYRG
jgi:hypothetical protein